MKRTIEELKHEIDKLVEDKYLGGIAIYDFQNYEHEIEELKKYLQEKNITQIIITNNHNMGIAIDRTK